MKLYVGMCVLNEADYLPYTLNCLYPVADRILIVEGATQFCWDFAGPEGLSTDGTTEIIRDYPDPERKMEYLPVGRVDYIDALRNIYWERVPEDALLMVSDGDEGWFPEEIDQARAFLAAHPEFDAGRADYFCFRYDFQHAEICPNGGTTARMYRRDRMAPYQHSAHVLGDWSKNYFEMALTDPGFRCLHFGWVRGPRKLYEKCLWTVRYWQELSGKYPGLTDAELKREVFKLNDWNWEADFPEYNGPLPAGFSAHPLARQSREEILPREEVEQLKREAGILGLRDLVSIDWDAWRNQYETLSDQKQKDFMRIIEILYPLQNWADYEQVRAFLGRHSVKSVLEIGGYKGQLARTMLEEYPEIEQWVNIDYWAGEEAGRYCGQPVDQFRWWQTWPRAGSRWPSDALVMCHFVEHLSWSDLKALFDWLGTAIPFWLIEAPLQWDRPCWEGYWGTHILEVQWPEIVAELARRGYRGEQRSRDIWEFTYVS